MKELPILFSTAMVEAKLSGRKTQTRRIVKSIENESQYQKFPGHEEKVGWYTFIEPDQFDKKEKMASVITCPYGKPGDLLWTREAWRSLSFDADEHTMGIQYRASHGATLINHVKMKDDYKLFCTSKFKPSIHMPKAAARIWDEVTDIRIERLADISENDAIAEGVEQCHYTPTIIYKNYCKGNGYDSARESFKSLFLSINGKVTPVKNKSGAITHYEAIAWDEQDYKDRFEYSGGFWRDKPLKVTINPWVWVISYKNVSTTGRPSTVTAAAAI